jgi:hypothetical protein
MNATTTRRGYVLRTDVVDHFASPFASDFQKGQTLIFLFKGKEYVVTPRGSGGLRIGKLLAEGMKRISRPPQSLIDAARQAVGPEGGRRKSR